MNLLSPSRPSRMFLLGAFCVLSFATAATAQQDDTSLDIDWKKGVWSELIPNLGTYNYDNVLKNPKVKPQIDALLKGKNVDLAQEFEVKAPIGFENDCLILQGNPAQRGDTDGIYLDACVSSGKVHIALLDSGKITVFSDENQFEYLPNGLKTWVYLQSNDKMDLSTKPANVQMMVKAK